MKSRTACEPCGGTPPPTFRDDALRDEAIAALQLIWETFYFSR